jgi:cell division protein FtsQ
MIYTPLAAVLVLIIIIFGVSVFFRVTAVEVTGSSRYTADEIIAAAGIQTGDNLFLIDSDAAARRITASKPYVSRVQIERRIPDAAIIRVTESVAFAVVSEGGDYWKLDASGRILEHTDFSGTVGLIRVSGLNAQNPREGAQLEVAEAYKTQLGYLLDIFKAIDGAGIGRDVSNLDITNISAITFVYRGAVDVRFGGGENAEFKLKRLLTVLADKPDDFKGQVLLDRDDQISVIER